MNECCDNCRFHFQRSNTYVCRRNPPVISLPLYDPEPPARPITQPIALFGVPTTPTWWCGEWQEDTTVDVGDDWKEGPCGPGLHTCSGNAYCPVHVTQYFRRLPQRRK